MASNILDQVKSRTGASAEKRSSGEPQPGAKPQTSAAAGDDAKLIDRFVKAAGKRLFDGPEIGTLLGPHCESLVAGEAKPYDHPLATKSRRIGTYLQSGVEAGAVVKEARRTHTPIRLSAIAKAMITTSIADLAAGIPDEAYHAKSAARHLGIDDHEFRDADALDGQAVPIGEIAAWVSRTSAHSEIGIVPLRKLLRRRELEAIEAKQRAEEEVREKTILERAADARKELERQQAAEASEERQRMLRAYREILSRRHDPAEGDPAALAWLQIDLGLSDEDTARHIALLDQVASLEELHKTADEKAKAAEAAAAEAQELQAAANRLKDALKARDQLRHQAGIAARAPRDISEIKQRHRDLFGLPAEATEKASHSMGTYGN